ncbi:MAG: porin [Planctomycetota bacterium]
MRELPPFFERTMFALVPFRQSGAASADSALEQRATWAIAGYRYNSDPLGNVFTDSGGYGMATRVTGLLLDDGERVVHVGGVTATTTSATRAAALRLPERVRRRDQRHAGHGVPFFVDTGPLTVTTTDLFDVEAAFGAGPFAVQAEARLARVGQASGTQEFHPLLRAGALGLYSAKRSHHKGNAVFGRVVPRANAFEDGIGAIELAARVSQIDLDDRTSTPPGRHLRRLQL